MSGDASGAAPAARPDDGWGRAALIFLAGFSSWALLVSAANGPMVMDSTVLATMVAARRPWLTAAAQIITWCGTSQVLLPVAVLVGGWAVWRGRRWLTAALVLVALPVSERAVEVVKLLSDRARPPMALMLGAPVLDPSFPSGHTTSAAAVLSLAAIVLVHHSSGRLARRVWLATASAAIVLVGLSRMYLGYHWLSDVIGGWLLAGALTSAALWVARQHAAVIGTPGLPLNRIGVTSTWS